MKNPIGMAGLLTFFRDTLLTERTTNMDSAVHRRDTRIKLVSLLLIIICAVILENIIFFGVLFIILISLVLLSRIPLKLYIVRASFIPLFTVLIALPLPFIVPGNILTIIPTFGFNYLTVSFEGLYRTIVFVSRVWISVGAAVLLVSTSKFSDIAMALRKMGAPEILTTLLLITYRYIFLFADEALSMVQARNMRNFGKEGFIKRIKVVGQMIGTLFLRAFERGEQVYYAMLSRGYVGKLEIHTKLKIGKTDVVFLCLIFTIILSLIFMDLMAFNFTTLNHSYLTYIIIDLVVEKVYIFTDFTRTFWGLLVV